MIIKLSMPTWLYINRQHINLMKSDCLDHFPPFLLQFSIHIFSLNMAGLTINPV